VHLTDDVDNDVLPYPTPASAAKKSPCNPKGKQKFFVLTAAEAHAAKLKYQQEKQVKLKEKEDKKQQREAKRQQRNLAKQETSEIPKGSQVTKHRNQITKMSQNQTMSASRKTNTDELKVTQTVTEKKSENTTVRRTKKDEKTAQQKIRTNKQTAHQKTKGDEQTALQKMKQVAENVRVDSICDLITREPDKNRSSTDPSELLVPGRFYRQRASKRKYLL
jgi:hypothetical protein